jgi:hypothetical protein
VRWKVICGLAALACVVFVPSALADGDPAAAVTADVAQLQSDLTTLAAGITSGAPRATIRAERRQLAADRHRLLVDIRAARAAGVDLRPLADGLRQQLRAAVVSLHDAIRQRRP